MDKSITQMAASTQEAMQTRKALHTLASGNKAELPEVIQQLEKDSVVNSEGSAASSMKDVTAEFLAPVQDETQTLTNSSICVYKGILRRLAGMTPKPNTVALLAGSGLYVLNVVVAETLECALGSETVRGYLKEKGHEILGLAVWGSISDPKQYQESMLNICKAGIAQTKLLLLAVQGHENPDAWVASVSENASVEQPFEWLPVRVGGQNNHRKRHGVISFTHATKIGVTFEDEVRGEQVQNYSTVCFRFNRVLCDFELFECS